MPARRRHRGDQARDEVGRLEDQRASTVAPSTLEAELELAVSAALEAVLRDRGARDVPLLLTISHIF